jgi:glycosyltransferase involved in cell wall biosynthesis
MFSPASIGVIVNVSLKELTAHPLFCLQLCHELAKFSSVDLYIPRNEASIDKSKLERELGFPLNFRIETVTDKFFGFRSLRFFFYLSVLLMWCRRKNLLWVFEPYSIQLASFLGIRSVMEIHSSLPPARYINIAKRIQKSGTFGLFIANSEAHCSLLASKGFIKDKLLGAHNAIAKGLLNRSEARRNSGFWSTHGVSEAAVVTYAGSLYKGRGLESILEVAPRLPHCAFVILGGPDAERKKLMQRTKSSNVYFLGSISPRQVPAFLTASDILVALYDEDCEDVGGNKTILTASPMKLFEYMAAGVPIISSNIGAIPEIIENGRSGLLIQPGDVDQFKNSIQRLMTDKTLAAALSSEALARVKQYSWEHRLRRIFERLSCTCKWKD